MMEFYRYETVEYGSNDIGIPNPTLVLRKLKLVKETPKGYWICFGDPDQLHSDQRWVSKTAKKRYAYPTKAEALNNFILRKKRQRGILKYALERCETDLELGLSEKARKSTLQ